MVDFKSERKAGSLPCLLMVVWTVTLLSFVLIFFLASTLDLQGNNTQFVCTRRTSETSPRVSLFFFLFFKQRQVRVQDHQTSGYGSESLESSHMELLPLSVSVRKV